MKLIKKYDNEGNEYYEEILETDEEIKESFRQTKKHRKSKKIRMLIYIAIITIALLFGFNIIKINIFGEHQTIIQFAVALIATALLTGEAKR